MTIHRRLQGFSLVELMVAMVIGLMLLSGMVSVFSGNKRSSDLNTAMANLQENARFALDRIASDIRMSGFQGCIDINRSAATILAADKPTTNFRETATQASVVIAKDNWTPAPPSGFDESLAGAKIGTHSLTLQFGEASTFPLAQVVGTGVVADRSAPMILDITPATSSRPFDMQANDYAIISDCAFADLFRISSVSNQSDTRVTLGHAAPSNTTGAFSTDFGGDDNIRVTKVMRFVSNVYYVADTGITNDQGDTISALYQQSLPYNDASNPPVELIRGVENMRIAFGLRRPNGSLLYVLPDDAAFDASQVETIRIGLLMNSFDRIADTEDSNNYILAGQTIAPAAPGSTSVSATHAGDRRFRLAFNTTVKVRNRRSSNL